MNLTNHDLTKWGFPTALATGWGIYLMVTWGTESTILGIIGCLTTLGLITVILREGGRPVVQWNESRKVMVAHKRWMSEVSAGSLYTSVPLSIDVSHSGKKVLRAMNARLQEEKGGEVRFFVNRPLGEGPTGVGYIVVRRAPRLFLRQRIEKLADTVAEDVSILESAMRAVTPHTPVRRATLADLVRVSYGGVDVHAPRN